MSKYDLSKVLPHSYPMILVNDILNYNIDEKWLVSEIVIEEKSLFYDKSMNGVSSTVGIEFMAQTIGCYAYFKNKCANSKIGFLLGTRLYTAGVDIFPLGERYTLKVNEIFTDEQIVVFDCIMYDKCEEEVASATINVYQSDDIEEFIINNE